LGSLAFEPFLDGLHDAGYTGPPVLEIFSRDVADSLYDSDLEGALRTSREALERLERARGTGSR